MSAEILDEGTRTYRLTQITQTQIWQCTPNLVINISKRLKSTCYTFLRMAPHSLKTIKTTLKVHVIFSQDDPPLPEDDENKEKRTDDISSWDADFLKVDKGKQ